MIFGPQKRISSLQTRRYMLQAAALPDLLDFSPEVASNFWGLHIYIVILFHGAEGLNDFFWQSLKKSLLPFRLMLGF